MTDPTPLPVRRDDTTPDPRVLSASLRELADFVDAHADAIGDDRPDREAWEHRSLMVSLHVHPAMWDTPASWTALCDALGLDNERSSGADHVWRDTVPFVGVEVSAFMPKPPKKVGR